MAATGQTINDRINAVRYALVGQGLARTVCKATTLEVLGPKKKHIDYLLACTNEPNVSTPDLANLLIERTQHTNWAVVFKALISIHNLMSYGNERFTQYLVTSNHSFELADFMDRTTPQGYNMSTFVRRYAKYINDKSISYRTLAIDLCKIRSGNDNALRTMNMENLSKTLPIVQAQFDSLLDFCAEPKDLNNGVIMAAFKLLYKDLVKLYVAYQEAIINLLERYFKLSRKKTREALEMYKNYLSRMDKVAVFLRVVEAVELDKSEMPDLTNSPASILKLLEQHLAQLEAKKRGVTPTEQGEEEHSTATDNKENEAQTKTDLGASSTEADNEARKTEMKTPDLASNVKQTQQSTAAVNVELKQEKQKPPQKPARPSPKASPRASPKCSSPVGSPNSTSSKQTPSPGPSPAPPSASEKKGPPERPAKPPSRPPPPSACPAQPAPSGTVASDTTTSLHATKEESEGQFKSLNEVVAPTSSPPNPPPHPPPPTNHYTSPTVPASAAEPTNSPVSPASAPSHPPPPQPVISTEEMSSPVQEISNSSETLPTTYDTQVLSCSSFAQPAERITGSNELPTEENNTTRSVVQESVGENHVNNVNHNEELLPPPPPPIEEDENDEVVAQEDLREENHQEPVANGESAPRTN